MTTLKYSPLILLVNFILGINASTCPADNSSHQCCSDKSPHQCCPFGGLGRQTCPGQGTSDIADLIAKLYKTEEQYCLLGQTKGLFYIFSSTYEVLYGGRATLTLRANVGYAIEVPSKTGCGESTIYLITITGCVEIRVIQKGGQRKLTGTPLTDEIIYNAIRKSNRPYKAPCNTVVGADPRRFSQYFDWLALYLNLDLSRALSFQYILFNGRHSREPDRIIAENRYQISRANDPETDTYVISDYLKLPKVFQNCSSRPDNGIPAGVALNLVGFDFSPYWQYPQLVLCALSLQVSKFGASTFYPYYLYFEKIILLSKPYDRMICINGYVDTDIGIIINKKLVQLC